MTAHRFGAFCLVCLCGCADRAPEPPAQQPFAPQLKADDPDGARMLDELERELPLYEAAVDIHVTQKPTLAAVEALTRTQDKVIGLTKSLKDAMPRLSLKQAEKARALALRAGAAAGRVEKAAKSKD